MKQLTHMKVESGIAWITIDDGKVNVMSQDMLEEIVSRLDGAGDSPVVLRGRRGIFSAGFDMRTLQRGPDESRGMMSAGVDLIEKMLLHPRPIIAVCTGHAYPMGAFLLLCADIRFGIAGDWNIGLNEVAIGITVPHFAVALARHRLSQHGVARITSAEMFNPEHAVAAGYLDFVVAESDVDAAVSAKAMTLKQLHMPSYVATKARINGPVREAIHEAWEFELQRGETVR